MNMNEAFGKAFRYHRNLRGLIQDDFEDKQSAVSRLERAGQWPTPKTLDFIIAKLGVPMSQIWATAEGLLGQIPRQIHQGDKSDRQLREEDDRIRRSEYQVVLATVVLEIISTTPNAAPMVRSFLQAAMAMTKDKADRSAYRNLIGQVGIAGSHKRKKSASARVRAASQ